jgi:N-acetylmuramoyl-L-alanine amidase
MIRLFILVSVLLWTVPPALAARPFSTVVIDAGHGGSDAGGIRQNLIPEKGVALDVARRLRAQLANAGLRTVMTRNSDVFIPLGTRVSIANAQSRAIFVSIHFNSALRVGARGIETYYSAPSGIPLARRIQTNLMTTTSGENRGIKRANYYVLRKTKCTAVLVECGFLTNPQDAALASSASYRERLATQIARAIISYRNSL